MFGTGSTLYVTKSTNDLVFEIAVEYEILRAEPERSISQEARFQVLQKKLEIAGKDNSFFISSLGVVIGVGILMVWFGFKKWHTEVQPIQDEIARLSIRKLRRELGEDESA